MSHDIIAVAVLGCWFYLIAARGAFWLSSGRDDSAARTRMNPCWPASVGLIDIMRSAVEKNFVG